MLRQWMVRRHVANFAHHGRRRRVIRFRRLSHHINWWWSGMTGLWRRLLGVPRVELAPLVHLVVGVRIFGVALAHVRRRWSVHHGRRWWWMHLFELWRRNRLASAGICMMVLHRSVVRHGWERRMAQVVVSVRRPDEISSGGGRVDSRRRLHRWGRRSCTVGHACVEVETSSIGTVLLKRRWLGWHVRVGGRMRLDMRRRWRWNRC